VPVSVYTYIYKLYTYIYFIHTVYIYTVYIYTISIYVCIHPYIYIHRLADMNPKASILYQGINYDRKSFAVQIGWSHSFALRMQKSQSAAAEGLVGRRAGGRKGWRTATITYVTKFNVL